MGASCIVHHCFNCTSEIIPSFYKKEEITEQVDNDAE
jgi:hypothetical protein